MPNQREPDALDEIIHRAEQIRTADEREPVKVITIRIPQSLHASLAEEAHDRRTSMNKLASAKLRITGDALDRLLQAQEEQL